MTPCRRAGEGAGDGLDPHEAFPHLAGLERDDLLERAADRWRLTPRGLLVADSVFATFL